MKIDDDIGAVQDLPPCAPAVRCEELVINEQPRAIRPFKAKK